MHFNLREYFPILVFHVTETQEALTCTCSDPNLFFSLLYKIVALIKKKSECPVLPFRTLNLLQRLTPQQALGADSCPAAHAPPLQPGSLSRFASSPSACRQKTWGKSNKPFMDFHEGGNSNIIVIPVPALEKNLSQLQMWPSSRGFLKQP